MDQLLKSVRSALKKKNYYVALFTALTLPDICAASEHGRATPARYSAWWEEHLSQYKGFLSGNDCYALRCAVLHQGKDDITEHTIREALDYCVFLTKGPNLSLFSNCEFNGKNQSFLQLNVQSFCEDVCGAVEKWMQTFSKDPVVLARVNETVEIHEPGYVHLQVIRFGEPSFWSKIRQLFKK